MSARRGGTPETFLLLLAASTVVVNDSACSRKADVSFEVGLPADLVERAAWFEVGAFRSSCALVGPNLAGGFPEGSVARVGFGRDTAAPPLGSLEANSYSFAAVARDVDCQVVATGCLDVDVTSEGTVKVELAAAEPGRGQCGPGQRCEAARCVPVTDNGDPRRGAGCSMDLVGAGPLGNPLGNLGIQVSAPAVADSGRGFLVTYREYDPLAGLARLAVLPIDPGGGALAPLYITLPERCPQTEEADGTGFAFDRGAKTGLVAVARPACAGQSRGLDLIAVDEFGALAPPSGFASSEDLLSLSHAKAVSTRAGGGYFVAYSDPAATNLLRIDGVRLADRPAGIGGGGRRTSTWVAANQDRVAVLSLAPEGVDRDDGGADSGDAASFDAGLPDPGSTSSLRLQVVNGAAPPSIVATAPVLSFPGSFGSLTLLGARVFVVSDITGSVAWRLYDENNELSPPNIIGPPTDGVAVFADAAASGDNVFVATERIGPSGGSIGVTVLGNATTSPEVRREIAFAHDPRIPPTQTVGDGRVAVAASANRALVVWTTRRLITDQDAVGGYALFACSP